MYRMSVYYNHITEVDHITDLGPSPLIPNIFETYLSFYIGLGLNGGVYHLLQDLFGIM